VFRTRYVGDWGFRKRVDAGWTADEIAAAEEAEAAERAAAEKAAARAIRDAEKAEQRARDRVARRKPRPAPVNAWRPDEIQRIRDMHAAGELDIRIAEVLGRNASSVTKRRSAMGLPRNTKHHVITHGTRGGYDSGCRGTDCPSTPSCGDEGRRYYRELSAKHRRRDGVQVHAERTTCRRGHELTGDNVFVRESDGRRRCARCRDAQYKAWSEKRRAAA
jgi:hypothetical protein